MSLARTRRRGYLLVFASMAGPTRRKSNVTIDIGLVFKPTELTQHDHFLTARWRLFSITGRGMFREFSASACCEQVLELAAVRHCATRAVGVAPRDGPPRR